MTEQQFQAIVDLIRDMVIAEASLTSPRIDRAIHRAHDLLVNEPGSGWKRQGFAYPPSNFGPEQHQAKP